MRRFVVCLWGGGLFGVFGVFQLLQAWMWGGFLCYWGSLSVVR